MKQERRQNGRCNRVVRLKKPDGLLEARDFSHGFFTNKIGLKLDSKTLIPYIKNIKEQLMADEQLKNAARQNEECDFATVYYNKIEAIFVQELKNLYGVGDNSKVEGLSKKEKEDRIEFTRAMMNVEMRRRIFGMYLDEVHQKMREEKE